MSARPRVSLVCRRVWPAHGPGGLERHVHDQTLQLAGAGLRVELFSETPRSAERRRRAEAVFGAAGVALHWLAPGPLPLGRPGTVILDRNTNYLWWSRRAGRAVAAARPDVVHAHGLGVVGVARLADPARVVLTTHGMEEFVGPGWKRLAYAPFRWAFRRAARRVHRVIVTDRVLLPLVRRVLGVGDDRLIVIPNVVDPEACRKQADREAAQRVAPAAGRPRYVSVGRLAPNKGFELLAAAFGAAQDRLPRGWSWVLVGDGPWRARIVAAARRAGIADRLRLVGAVDDATTHGLLASADWFVHPTRYEGSSLVTLEAMAHGLPVLATAAGGLPDKVIDGKTGLLVPPGDAAALAAGLVRTVEMDARALGAAGRSLVERRFSWAAVLPDFLRLYDEIAGST